MLKLNMNIGHAGTGGSLGPTAAAGWAALPSQFNWWHWLANEVDLQRCQDD